MANGHHQRLNPRSRRPVACHRSPCHQAQAGLENFYFLLWWVLLEDSMSGIQIHGVPYPGEG